MIVVPGVLGYVVVFAGALAPDLPPAVHVGRINLVCIDLIKLRCVVLLFK